MLLDEVRLKTIRILKSVPVESTHWARPGLHHTILWHAGHAYVLVEWLTMTSLKRELQIPAGWFEMFSGESSPSRVPPSRRPALCEVIRRLEAQHKRVVRNHKSRKARRMKPDGPDPCLCDFEAWEDLLIGTLRVTSARKRCRARLYPEP
jgi:hypothetical protein